MDLEGTVQQPIWVSGQGEYHTYRIPAIVETNSGSILAFCEGRRMSRSDAGDIDLLVKRSTDGGETWGETIVVWNDPGNTCGNPCPIVDRETGVIWLLMTWNRGEDREPQIIAQESIDTRRVFVTCSSDDGLSWETPLEITDAVKRSDWTWFATGPGAGIQIERGKYRGRMVAPCDHIEAGTRHYYSHVIYSDNHGETWRLGGRTPLPGVNECEVVELPNSRLMLNMRNYDRSRKHRQIAYSYDGGDTWVNQKHDTTLIEPICQASIRRYSWQNNGEPGVILFSNPADTEKRVRMTVRASLDDGESWKSEIVLWEGPSAYSDLLVTSAGQIACLYERGENDPYETITFARVPRFW